MSHDLFLQTWWSSDTDIKSKGIHLKFLLFPGSSYKFIYKWEIFSFDTIFLTGVLMSIHAQRFTSIYVTDLHFWDFQRRWCNLKWFTFLFLINFIVIDLMPAVHRRKYTSWHSLLLLCRQIIVSLQPIADQYEGRPECRMLKLLIIDERQLRLLQGMCLWAFKTAQVRVKSIH